MTKQTLILLFITIVGSVSAADVRLRSSVVCPAPVVRLADVAEIRGDDAVLTEALGYVTLCPAPPPGAKLTFSQHQVRQLLALSGVEPSHAIVTGSESVELIAEASPARRRATPPPGTIRQALFTAEEAAAPAPGALGTRITPRTLAPPGSEAVNARLVQRGAVVNVSARRPGIRVTTSGKALEAGSAGDTISVELTDSRERVLARVVGPQTVEVAANPVSSSK